MTNTTAAAHPVSTDADKAVAFANAALALAGHEITDPYLNELFARQMRGEISGDVARELGRKHILGR